MANMSCASCPGADPAAFRAAFRTGLEEAAVRFGDALVLRSLDRGAEAALALPDGTVVARALFSLEEDARAEWWSGPGELDWWLQETLAAAASRRTAEAVGLPVLLAHEGLPEPLDGEPSPPRFDLRYPRFRDYEERWRGHLRRHGPALRLTVLALDVLSRFSRDPLRPIRPVLDPEPAAAERATPDRAMSA